METHELKTDSEVFQPVYKGWKNYEIRFEDRGFKVGDRLLLMETRYSGDEMKKGKPLEYTGRSQVKFISHILSGPIYGLLDGWVILSF